MRAHSGPETDTRVHQPGLALALPVALLFILMGSAVGGLFEHGLQTALVGRGPFVDNPPPPPAIWLVRTLAGSCLAVGIAVFLGGLWAAVAPRRVRHASAATLPEVSREPVVWEGLVVQWRVVQELQATPEGWELRPSRAFWRLHGWFLPVFGVTFCPAFAGLLSYLVRDQWHVPNWPLALLLGGTITALCGGPVFLIVAFHQRYIARRLGRLGAPHDGELQLELATAVPTTTVSELLNSELLNGDVASRPTGKTKRQLLAIPRHRVVAVQVCPCKATLTGRSHRTCTRGLQGLLVLNTLRDGYARVPLLVSMDCLGTARLMQALAERLNVPFLFAGDSAAWGRARRVECVGETMP